MEGSLLRRAFDFVETEVSVIFAYELTYVLHLDRVLGLQLFRHQRLTRVH